MTGDLIFEKRTLNLPKGSTSARKTSETFRLSKGQSAWRKELQVDGEECSSNFVPDGGDRATSRPGRFTLGEENPVPFE